MASCNIASSLCRYGANLALKHLPPGEHSELWHGESVVRVRPQGLQQCGVRLRWRQHHYQGERKKVQHLKIFFYESHLNFASIWLCTMSVTSFSLHLSALLSIPLLCRWVGRSQPCRWTQTERSSGLNTVKYSKPTWRQWVTLRSRMERGCHWLSKTWAAVRFTPKPSSITRMEGMNTLSPGSHDCLQWPD